MKLVQCFVHIIAENSHSQETLLKIFVLTALA